MSAERQPTPGAPSRIGILGTGAMGTAMAVGLARGAPVPELLLVDPVPGAAAAAAAASGGRVAESSELGDVDLLVLAVKPADAPAVLAASAAVVPARAAIASVVAGLTLSRLAESAPRHAVVRLMPNLAVRQGAGLVALAARATHDAAARSVADVLAPCATVVRLPESLFPAATALAGSGPGLLALIAEALEEGGVASGLTRASARAMSAAVFAGTAALLADGEDPARLRQQVTSPGGTTAAGVAVLERGAVRSHVADAVRAAADRAAEL